MKSIDFDILTKTTIGEEGVSVTQEGIDISSIRGKLGLDQSEFADILGISGQLLKAWEEGTVEPPKPIMLLFRVADRWPVAFIDSLIDY